MNEMSLHGIVGIDITAQEVEEQLAQFEGDVLVNVNSAGGYITQGVAIMNAFRGYTSGKIIFRISFAGSMMTQIVMTGDEVQVYENSIFFVHNAQGVAIGDHRELDRMGRSLKAMSLMLAKVYMVKTGKEKEEIVKLMDNNTTLFGSEIKEYGFADTVLDAEDDEQVTMDSAMAMLNDSFEAVKMENLTADQFESQLRMCAGECNLPSTPSGATAFRDLPIVDGPWDETAAEKRVREFTANDERYSSAFFWYNSYEPNASDAHKFPFADVVDGKLVANIQGVRAANVAMADAKVPASDKAEVQSHIDRYLAKWERTKPKEENQVENLEQLKNEFPAIYDQAVGEGASAAEADLTEIAAMAFEYNVGKETAMKMLETKDVVAATKIALKAVASKGGTGGQQDFPEGVDQAMAWADIYAEGDN